MKRLHAAAYVLRVPSEREERTALAIRFATAGGISGSTATELALTEMPIAVVTAGFRRGWKSISAA
ncbi:hypothetical protein [Rhodococcus sp. NPDC076796]|uniref:hypothetical protein n=1 Tax=Rhodococcus sp. NPDC076796 TaxID=3154859 RepID=UPI0034504356